MLGEISGGGWPVGASKVCKCMKKDVFWVVIGHGWSRDHTWDGLLWW